MKNTKNQILSVAGGECCAPVGRPARSPNIEVQSYQELNLTFGGFKKKLATIVIAAFLSVNLTNAQETAMSASRPASPDSMAMASPSAEGEHVGDFENLPTLSNTNAINGTLADIGALNDKLDQAIAQSQAVIDSYGQSISAAAASFTPAASNRVEEAEMEALRVTAQGLGLFVASGPRALELHAKITAKGDRVAALVEDRIATRVEAAKRLAKARNVSVDVVQVDLTPSEAATLREWSLVSDEVRFTETGTRLHVDRLEQIMTGIRNDRLKLAQDGESLGESIKRMEMLQRVIKRFADDAVAEQRFQRDTHDFQDEAKQFSSVAERYRQFTHLGEQSIQPRLNNGVISNDPLLGGPVQ